MRATVLATALVLYVSMAGAHEFWLEPASHRVAPGDRVDVTIMIGHHDDLNSFPRRAGHAKSFRIVGAQQAWDIQGDDGDDPAGTVTAPEAGTYWLVYHGNPSFIEMEAEKFENYLRQEGLQSIIEQRAARGEQRQPGREAYARCAKAVLQVGNRASEVDAEFLRKPVGLPLELILLNDPFTLKPGDELHVRLLHDGKPLANALIEAIHRQRDEQSPKSVSVRTDDRGDASLSIARPGTWIVASTHMMRKAEPSSAGAIPAGDPSRADWESYWATLSVEIAP